MRKTILCEDRKHRYTLWREWDMSADLIATMPGYDLAHEYLNVIGLNPSTADETRDDPTIRRCIDFAQRFGFGALCMTNLFAYRATRPRELLAARDPVGRDNNEHIVRAAHGAGMVLCGWGQSVPIIRQRADFVTVLLQNMGVKLRCLHMNKDGSPQHPLYISADKLDEPFHLCAGIAE
jgi:hypothetical protein